MDPLQRMVFADQEELPGFEPEEILKPVGGNLSGGEALVSNPEWAMEGFRALQSDLLESPQRSSLLRRKARWVWSAAERPVFP